MEQTIISKNNIIKFWSLSHNISEERINLAILKAQQIELKSFLGDALYFDFVTNITDAKYQILLNGGTYERLGKMVFYCGVEQMLSAYSYAHFVKANPFTVTRAGNKNKGTLNSTEVDERTTNIKVTEAISEGVRLQDEVYMFLEANRDDYNLFDTGRGENAPTLLGVDYIKVPRKIQR